MIVISGALVLVAIILLVIGIISSKLAFVYASIGVSIGAFVFLILGILQRRGEDVPETAAAPPVSTAGEIEGVTAIIPASARSRGAEVPAAAETPVAPVATGSVLVVEGRPRYHVAGCRYLTGKDASEVPAADARSEGYTACGVCKPDEALTASAPTTGATAEVAEPAAATRRTTAKAPARTAVAKATKAPAKAATKAPTKAATKTAAKKAPAKKAATSSTTAAAKTLAKKSAATKSPAKKAPSKAAASAAGATLAKKTAAKKTAAKKTAAKKTAR